MNRHWLSAIAVTLLIGSQITSPLAAPTKAAMAAVTTACTDLDATSRVRGGCATELQKSLAADPASIRALKGVATADSDAGAKDVLKKLGMTDAELADATIVVKDESGGASRVKVTVEITCCPVTIVITIRF